MADTNKRDGACPGPRRADRARYTGRCCHDEVTAHDVVADPRGPSGGPSAPCVLDTYVGVARAGRAKGGEIAARGGPWRCRSTRSAKSPPPAPRQPKLDMVVHRGWSEVDCEGVGPGRGHHPVEELEHLAVAPVPVDCAGRMPLVDATTRHRRHGRSPGVVGNAQYLEVPDGGGRHCDAGCVRADVAAFRPDLVVTEVTLAVLAGLPPPPVVGHAGVSSGLGAAPRPCPSRPRLQARGLWGWPTRRRRCRRRGCPSRRGCCRQSQRVVPAPIARHLYGMARLHAASFARAGRG